MICSTSIVSTAKVDSSVCGVAAVWKISTLVIAVILVLVVPVDMTRSELRRASRFLKDTIASWGPLVVVYLPFDTFIQNCHFMLWTAPCIR